MRHEEQSFSELQRDQRSGIYSYMYAFAREADGRTYSALLAEILTALDRRDELRCGLRALGLFSEFLLANLAGGRRRRMRDKYIDVQRVAA